MIRYSRSGASRRGRSDGRLGLPSLAAGGTTHPSQHELELGAAGGISLRRWAERWTRRKQKLMKTVDNRRMRLRAARARLKQAEHERARLPKVPDAARIHWYGRRGSWWAVVALLIVVDGPLLAVVFRAYLESDLAAGILGLALGGVNAVVAHYVGEILHRWPTAGFRARVLAITGCVLVIAITGTSAILRNDFVASTGATTGMATYLLFFGLGLLLFVAATFVAFEQANQSVRAIRAHRRAEKKVRRANARVDRAARRYTEGVNNYRIAYEKTVARAQSLQQAVIRLCSAYRRANERARNRKGSSQLGSVPFAALPDVPMPDIFDEPPWVDLDDASMDVPSTENGRVKIDESANAVR